MPSRQNRGPRTPQYLHHKASGQAYTYVADENGKRKAVYLGP